MSAHAPRLRRRTAAASRHIAPGRTHQAGETELGDRVVDRAVARPDQGVHRMDGEAEGEHGEDGRRLLGRHLCKPVHRPMGR